MANKSENKFSVGDKVVRTGGNRDYVTQGDIYTVERCTNKTVYLAECMYGYSPDLFELVEQKEKEMTFKNMKFDVAAIAKQLNVEHEESSRIIQEALFEQGYKWTSGNTNTLHQNAEGIYAYDSGEMEVYWSGTGFYSRENKEHCIKPTYTIVEAEEQQEIVELNGKKYNKQELEKALSLLKPID